MRSSAGTAGGAGAAAGAAAARRLAPARRRGARVLRRHGGASRRRRPCGAARSEPVAGAAGTAHLQLLPPRGRTWWRRQKWARPSAPRAVRACCGGRGGGAAPCASAAAAARPYTAAPPGADGPRGAARSELVPGAAGTAHLQFLPPRGRTVVEAAGVGSSAGIAGGAGVLQQARRRRGALRQRCRRGARVLRRHGGASRCRRPLRRDADGAGCWCSVHGPPQLLSPRGRIVVEAAEVGSSVGAAGGARVLRWARRRRGALRQCRRRTAAPPGADGPCGAARSELVAGAAGTAHLQLLPPRGRTVLEAAGARSSAGTAGGAGVLQQARRRRRMGSSAGTASGAGVLRRARRRRGASHPCRRCSVHVPRRHGGAAQRRRPTRCGAASRRSATRRARLHPQLLPPRGRIVVEAAEVSSSAGAAGGARVPRWARRRRGALRQCRRRGAHMRRRHGGASRCRRPRRRGAVGAACWCSGHGTPSTPAATRSHRGGGGRSRLVRRHRGGGAGVLRRARRRRGAPHLCRRCSVHVPRRHGGAAQRRRPTRCGAASRRSATRRARPHL